MYEDSFSEIPEAVLEAATPKPTRQLSSDPPEAEDEEDEELDLIVPPSVARSNSTVNYSHPQSDANRLLTPDETPSPDQGDDEHKSEHEAEEVPTPTTNQINEETPRPILQVNYAQDLQDPISSAVSRRSRAKSHSRNTSLETPVDPILSGASTRLSFASHRASLAPPESSTRPTLSPIMRAGRALQMVTSDPPSPPRQESLLRSPFRGSVRSTQSPALSATRATKSPTPRRSASGGTCLCAAGSSFCGTSTGELLDACLRAPKPD